MTEEASKLRSLMSAQADNAPKFKEAWLDLETTGLSSHRCAVHQLALIVFDKGKRYELKMDIRPHENAVIEPKALEATGTTIAQLNLNADPKQAYLRLKEFLNQFVDPYDKTDKLFLYGYNVRFDEDFLRAFFRRNNDNYFGSWFWSPSIDVMALAAERLKEERQDMKNFKLGTVYEHLTGEPLEGAHDAFVDIKATLKLYELLLG